MLLENINDIKSEIKKFEYENGHVSYSVVTKYRAHTLTNQIESINEADSVIDSHIGYIVSIYTTADYMYDPLTKSIVKRVVQTVDSSVGKKRGKKKEVEIEDSEEIPVMEENNTDDEYDYDADDRITELNGYNDDFTAPDDYSEDSYDSLDDYYDDDRED